MAAAADEIITDSLNLKISPTIPLEKVEAVFVDLGFGREYIKNRRSLFTLQGDLQGLRMDLLSSYKVKGCGLEAAEKLKAVMVNHEIDKARKLIQEAIDAVFPPVPKPDLQTDDDAQPNGPRDVSDYIS